jgi:hypothetical protein
MINYNIDDINNSDYNGIMREKKIAINTQGVMTVAGHHLSAVHSRLSNDLILSISLSSTVRSTHDHPSQITLSTISDCAAEVVLGLHMSEGLQRRSFECLKDISTGYGDTAFL